MLSIDLILRDDNLAREGVVGVGNGMFQDADGPDHLADFFSAVQNVAGVADELFALGKLQEEGKRTMSGANLNDCITNEVHNKCRNIHVFIDNKGLILNL